MNIFILDVDRETSASYLMDVHVRSTVREGLQMLATAHWTSNSPLPTQRYIWLPTHEHHPCTKWVAESSMNYTWLHKYVSICLEEWFWRWGRQSAELHEQWNRLAFVPPIPRIDLTPFVQAIPEQYRGKNAVFAYRRYYIERKQHLAAWTRRPVPDWWENLQ